MRRLLLAIVGVAIVASGCSERARTEIAAAHHPLFGVTQPLSAVVGTEIRSSQVVAMQCIPSRLDPVAVTLVLEISEWLATDDRLAVSVRTGETRLGSHPSGCSEPEPLLEQSMFLLGPSDQTILATNALETGDVTTLIFEFGDFRPAALSAVLLPTLEFTAGDGERQTTIFGFMGFYQLA